MKQISEGMENANLSGSGIENPIKNAGEILPEEILEVAGHGDGNGNRKEGAEMIAASIEDTGARLAELREEMGLPSQEGDAPSVAIEKELLGKEDQEEFPEDEVEEKVREEARQQERQKLIEEEKARILQEKINGLFEEFGKLGSQEMQNVLASGQPAPGKNMESKHMGELNKEDAKSLAAAFQEGIKLLPEILKRIPKLLEDFNRQLIEEAEKNVDKQLEEQEAKKNKASEDIVENEKIEGVDEPEELNDQNLQDNTVSAGANLGI